MIFFYTSFVIKCEAQILLKKELEEKAALLKQYKLRIESKTKEEEIRIDIIFDGSRMKITKKNLSKGTTRVYFILIDKMYVYNTGNKILQFVDISKLKLILKDRVEINFINKYIYKYDIRNPFNIDLAIPDSFRLIREEFINNNKYYKFRGKVIIEEDDTTAIGISVILLESTTGLPLEVIIYDGRGKVVSKSKYDLEKLNMQLSKDELEELEMPSLEQIDITEKSAKYLEKLYQVAKIGGYLH